MQICPHREVDIQRSHLCTNRCSTPKRKQNFIALYRVSLVCEHHGNVMFKCVLTNLSVKIWCVNSYSAYSDLPPEVQTCLEQHQSHGFDSHRQV